MKELICNLFKKYGLEVTSEQLDKFEKYYNLVITENQKYNLTAITKKDEFAIKHILDCCLPHSLLPKGAKVIDIGAGAGFPSIPLKIIRPDLNILMLDSLNKRINFLNMVIAELGLKDISAIHSRAEDYAVKNRENFDVAVARAVASLSTLSEYCLPFVKVGGMFVALKGSSYEEELSTAQNAILTLGGKVQEIQKISVDEIESVRANIVIQKVKTCPAKYPRGKNLPRVKPL